MKKIKGHQCKSKCMFSMMRVKVSDYDNFALGIEFSSALETLWGKQSQRNPEFHRPCTMELDSVAMRGSGQVQSGSNKS